MATPKKKRLPGAPLREDINTDPRWLNWEFLAAFGVDDTGYTYLDAIKQHCCIRSVEDEWLEDLVRRVRRAHDAAGACAPGRWAAWRVLRRERMLIDHDLMRDLGVGGVKRPRAAFWWPDADRLLVVTTNWKVVPMTD